MKGRASGIDPVSQAQFTKIQELIYELRMDQVMTRHVVTISPEAPMAEAKQLMHSHRISGLPVVAGDDLVGVISVEDLLRWLEPGASAAPVSEWMTGKVHTTRSDQTAVQAIAKFGQYKVGRLPVVDREGRLVGIVTPGDIIGRVLIILDALYREEEARRPRTRYTVEDLVSEGATLTLSYKVQPGDFDRAGVAATRIKRVLESLGIDPPLVRRAGIAAYEAEMNLVIHTDRGGVLRMEIRPEGLIIEASDEGPGIGDLAQALTPGFSTAPDWIRELGFGAGMGLHNINNCSDQFNLESEVGKGTLVRASIKLSSK